MTKGKKSKKWFIIAIIVVIVALAGGGYLYTQKKKNAVKTDGMKTELVKRGDIVESVSADGTVQPLTIVDVKSNVGGQVVQFDVDEGDYVTASQTIAMIDPTDSQTALDQANAGLTTSQAKIDQARLTLAMTKIQSDSQVQSAQEALKSAQARLDQAKEALDAQPQLTQASVSTAQANYDFAEKDLARQQQLFDKGYISKSDLEVTEQKNKVTKAQLDSANANSNQIPMKQKDYDAARYSVQQAEATLASAKAGKAQVALRQGDITQAVAGKVNTQATADNAKKNLSYTTVTAPAAQNGNPDVKFLVVKKYVEVGSIVASGRSSNAGTGAGVSIVTLADVTTMTVVVDVDETDIGKIKAGQDVNVTLDAYPNVPFKGKVTKIAPQATVTQNVTTVDVTVNILKPDERIKPGMNANCDFIIARKSDVLIVPNEAIKDSKGKKIVKVLEGGKAVDKPVETGLAGMDSTEIVSGLEEGDTVITAMPQPATGTGAASQSGGQSGGQNRSGGGGGGGGGRSPMGGLLH